MIIYCWSSPQGKRKTINLQLHYFFEVKEAFVSVSVVMLCSSQGDICLGSHLYAE